jgi:two-component system nitrate/nitrite response regulator NarL
MPLRGQAAWLVESNQLVISALRSLLRDTSFRIEREDALETVLGSVEHHAKPDVILTAIHSPLQGDGPEAAGLESLCRAFPDCPVVVLSDFTSRQQVSQALQAGVRGYLLSDISSISLERSLHLAVAGELVIASSLVASLVGSDGNSAPPMDLSERERQILSRLAAGEPNKVIARKMDIAEGTVKMHIQALFRKIDVTNRTEAAIMATRWQLAAGCNW